jgi:hypothetical protein
VLTPFHTWKTRSAPKRNSDITTTDIDRSIPITTVSSHIISEVEHANEDENPGYFAFPSPHANSPAASEIYTSKVIFNDWAPQEAIAQGYWSRWMETAKRNVFIDIFTPGRWAICSGTSYYIFEWQPKAQIWFCSDFGFGLAGDGVLGEGKLGLVIGTDPENDINMQGTHIWDGGAEGPGWTKTQEQFFAEGIKDKERERAIPQMWEQVEEWAGQDRKEAEMAKRRKEVKLQMRKRQEALRRQLIEEIKTKAKTDIKPRAGRKSQQQQLHGAKTSTYTRPGAGKKPSAAPPQPPKQQQLHTSKQGTTQSKPANNNPKNPHNARTQPKRKSLAEMAAENKAKRDQILKDWEGKDFSKEKKKPKMGERVY